MHPIPCKVVNGHTKYAFLYGSGDPIGSVPLLLMGETMRLREKATWIIPLSQKPPNKTSWWQEHVSFHAYSFCFTFILLQYFPLHFSNYRRVWFFVTSWTVVYQAPLSMGFSRQEYWSGLPCPSPGDFPDAGIKPVSLMSPALAGRFLTTSTTWEACNQLEFLWHGWSLFLESLDRCSQFRDSFIDVDSRGCELLHYLTDIYRQDLAITSNKFFLSLIYTFYINIVLFSAQNHLYSYVHYIISFIPTWSSQQFCY